MERIVRTSIHTDADSLTPAERAISLFGFIKELSAIKQKIVLNTKDYQWTLALSDLHQDSYNIEINYRDKVEEEHPDTSVALLKVWKREFQACPQPGSRIIEWLQNGWTDYRQEAAVYPLLERDRANSYTTIEKKPDPNQPDQMIDCYMEAFAASEERKQAYESWLRRRSYWVEQQKSIEKARDLFTDLYKLHIDLDRESETLEMIVSAGRLRDENNKELDHPILTRRVRTRFNAKDNWIAIEDAAGISTELCSMFLQQLDGINFASVGDLQADLQANDYHPLDRNDTPQFLKIFAHNISSSATFVPDQDFHTNTIGNRIVLCHAPAFHVRKRPDGTQKAVERIVNEIVKTERIPGYIADIVSGGTIESAEDLQEQTIDEQLASVGGESVDILLTKEANREQLEIARRIERYNAVLVQGPPGTGKTHTIANLMGHFLAQGKSILVTSHTKKALTVLKEKINPSLQSLCVSMLDDSNADMQKSVQGISDYMGQKTASELAKKVEKTRAERNAIMAELAETRKKIFALINQEYQSIVYLGEAISPSEAARFVCENEETLSYIPGEVELGHPLPLTLQELSELYRSNENLSIVDETELRRFSVRPDELIAPDAMAHAVSRFETGAAEIESIAEAQRWPIRYEPGRNYIDILFLGNWERITINQTAPLEALLLRVQSIGKIEGWMKAAAVDGKKGGVYRQKWLTLIDQIKRTCKQADAVEGKRFGKTVVLHDPAHAREQLPSLEKLRAHLAAKGKINKLDLLLHHEFANILQAFTINNQQIQSAGDCDLIISLLELNGMREQCAVYWDALFDGKGMPQFKALDTETPEQIAEQWIPAINRYLDWYENEYDVLLKELEEAAIPSTPLFQTNALDSELVAICKIMDTIEKTLPKLAAMLLHVFSVYTAQKELDSTATALLYDEKKHGMYATLMRSAIAEKNVEAYCDAYREFERLYAKLSLKKTREDLLSKLALDAPEWAEAIKLRKDIHGQAEVPENIRAAWKWKQLSGKLRKMYSEPYDMLQKRSLELSKEYRQATAKLAEKRAWYFLLARTEKDISMKQALNGWRQTVQRIGKGTGRNAPRLREEARKLMVKCQAAVPAWIMPMTKALEMLDPARNVFDVIIVDEASQSDVTSLAVAYMGKKLIVVGDDKQVSPSAIGEQIDKVNALAKTYIENIIPNAHLYNGKTSLYDIASTTFQPLMLREHFRCVPEIIGFSNDLSYDGRINPLREASSSNLLPAVVSYRVENGERTGKENPNEIKSILALIKSCMKQPEYEGKTFGIISMLSGEQISCIQKLLFEHFEPAEIESRRILFGTSENFQGDERDVVFLSLVDSNPSQGPLPLMGFGADEGNRKRYNVAASRAKDQLWVIHSLDPANDLKPGDMRKRLIDYALNPSAFEHRDQNISERADSPFEIAVVKALASRGYNYVQQWKVGAYRIDIVVRCGNKAIALECDGELYHSGEEKIREDMERQTILERLGWRFIRLRGGEYYRNPEKAIQRVCDKMTEYEIYPERCQEEQQKEERSSELLERVKAGAFHILEEWEKQEKEKPAPEIPEQKPMQTKLPKPSRSPKDQQESKKELADRKQEERQQLRLPIDESQPAGKGTTESIQMAIPASSKPKEKDGTLPKEKESAAEPKVMPDDEPKEPLRIPVRPKTPKPSTIPKHPTTERILSRKNKGERLIATLKEHNLEVIDNREGGGIIWVVDDPVRHEEIVALIGSEGMVAHGKFDRRGSIATGNRAAWRIMENSL